MPPIAAKKQTEVPAGWAALLLVVAALLAYLPALRGGFIFDDNVFLTGNPLIHAPDGLYRFWFSREAADYWPVTSSSLWVEWRLWGLDATGYHATNLLLHVTEALLFWAVLTRLTVPGAYFAALVFALHPLAAESVAWITERKNLLAFLFYLLSIFFFTGKTRAGCWLSLLAFALAMLSKGSVVILPLVLLGTVVWHRRPTVRDVWRLAPFFLLAGAMAVIEAQFSTLLGPGDMPAMGFLPRLLRAGAIVWFYAGKMLWPAGLCFDYGPWMVDAHDPRWWLPLGGAIGVTALFWHYRRSWSRPLLFGWGYFCVALLPVTGFAEVGFMRYSPVSDHFAHLAIPGVAALAGMGWAWLGGTAAAHRLGKAWPIGTAAVVAGALGILTWQQSRTYARAETLYRDTLACNPSSWIAHTNLGVMLYEGGRIGSAITHLEAAVRLKPNFSVSRNDLGNAYFKAGRLDEAIAQYGEALRLRPDYCEAHNNLGAALAASGRLPEAVAQFEQALRIDPDYHEAQLNLARALALERNGSRSIEQ